MEDEKPFSLIGETPANDQTEKTHEFKHDGVITGALVGTEVGQEYGLQNYAEIIRDGSRTNLWDPLDKEFLAGNGRDYERDLRLEFSEGDVLVLRAVNESDHPYHHAMMIDVDLETNLLDRIASALRGGL